MKHEIKTAIKELYPIVLKELIYILIIVFITCFVFSTVDFKIYSSVLGGLQVLASVVFAIVGLWIGSIYPNAITSIANDDVSYIVGTKDGESVEKLVNTIMISAFVMLSTLLIYLFKLTFFKLGIYEENRLVFKFLAVLSLYYISILQIRCILTVISSNYKFVSNLHSKINDAKLDQG